jgi:hypothetical protein
MAVVPAEPVLERPAAPAAPASDAVAASGAVSPLGAAPSFAPPSAGAVAVPIPSVPASSVAVAPPVPALGLRFGLITRAVAVCVSAGASTISGLEEHAFAKTAAARMKVFLSCR